MSQIYFIAEIGVNHDGSLQKAKKLVDAAKKAGATIAKFQTFVAEKLVTKTAVMADYQKENLKKDGSQFDMLKKLELSYEEFGELKKYCDANEIEFLSTGFDIESLKFLASMKPKYWKVPSGEITNKPYLEFIAKQPGIIFVSSGMATLQEVKDAVAVLKAHSTPNKEIHVMHCTSQYPADLIDVNLNVLTTFKNEFGENIGYSDHTIGIEVSLAAIALGAKVIEKHITLNTEDEGPDHKASILPSEFESLVNLGNNISLALGSFEKKPSANEIKTKEVARKSIVAKTSIKAGDTFSLENIDVKRPGTGMSPMLWDKLLGKKASQSYEPEDFIKENLS